jgi:hypothetical protein
LGACFNASPDMARTPISEIVATIEVVKTMQQTLAQLTQVVENLGGRVLKLEQRLDGKD